MNHKFKWFGNNMCREEIIGRIDINHIISEFASGNDKKVKVICIIT